MKENNVPGLGNPDDAQLRRTACTPESHIEQGEAINDEAWKWWNGLGEVRQTNLAFEWLNKEPYQMTVFDLKKLFKVVINQGTGSSEAGTERSNEAQPETPAPTTQDTNKCCLCNSFPCKCFGRIGEPPTTQLNQKEFDLLVNGRFDNPVSDDAPLLPPTTQQDKPVLSGEVYRLLSDFKTWAKDNITDIEGDKQKGVDHDERQYLNGYVSAMRDLLANIASVETRPEVHLPAPVVQDVEQFVGNVELFKEFWHKRNPAHESNADTGEDMFWGTAELVAREYVAHLQSLSKQSAPLQEEMAGQTDSDLLGWLEGLMSKDADYCEIFFSGLRNFTGEASAYQVESNPQRFETVNAPTLREAIKKAYAQSLQHSK